MNEYAISISWKSSMEWVERSIEIYRIAADSPDEAFRKLATINHHGYRPGHRQVVNSAHLVPKEDTLLRVGESSRMVYMEVRKDGASENGALIGGLTG